MDQVYAGVTEIFIIHTQMERKIVDLEDDMKEYWGFFLLADSYFRY